MTDDAIAAHGGPLVNRELTSTTREEVLKEAKSLRAFELQDFELSDIEMIASGALSPLQGFLGEKEASSSAKKTGICDWRLCGLCCRWTIAS